MTTRQTAMRAERVAFSVQETADALGVTRDAIYKAAQRGAITVVQPLEGGNWKIPRSWFEEAGLPVPQVT